MRKKRAGEAAAFTWELNGPDARAEQGLILWHIL